MEEGEDRLSELPDSLILYILSLIKPFSSKEVIRSSCLLSKRWQFLWTFMSEIELISIDYNKIRRYTNYVGRVLDMCSVNHLQRFSVEFHYDERFAPNLDSWLQIAVKRNVKDISFKCINGQRYKLAQILYSHSSLTTLSIMWCEMNHRVTAPAINWKSLKSLTIIQVNLSDNVMVKILSGCPILEALYLDMCYGFTRLNIFSKTFTKLKIRIFNYETPTIDISAPYARELKITKWDIHNRTHFRLRDILSLVRASINSYERTTTNMVELLQSLQYVKELNLGEDCLTAVSEFESLYIPPSTRSCLTLNLDNGVSIHGILCILKCSPYLKSLTIECSSCYMFKSVPDEEENIDLVFHHLKTINIRRIRTVGKHMMKLAQLLLKSARVLQEMNLTYKVEDGYGGNLIKDLIALPRASPKAIVTVNGVSN